MPARRAYAHVLRQVASGATSFDEHFPRYAAVFKTCGSDRTTQRMACWVERFGMGAEPGGRLGRPPYQISRSVRHMLARCVLLLHTDAEFSPPPRLSEGGFKLSPSAALSWGDRFMLGFYVAMLAPAVVVGFAAGSMFAGLFFALLLWLACASRLNATCARRVAASPQQPLNDDELPQFDESSPWPFASHDDLNRARRTLVYLCGKPPRIGACA